MSDQTSFASAKNEKMRSAIIIGGGVIWKSSSCAFLKP